MHARVLMARIFLTVPLPSLLPRLQTLAGHYCCALLLPRSSVSFCTNNMPVLTAQIRRGSPLVSAGRWLSSLRVAGPSLRLSPSRALGLLEVLLLHARCCARPWMWVLRATRGAPSRSLFREWSCHGQQAGSDSQPLG